MRKKEEENIGAMIGRRENKGEKRKELKQDRESTKTREEKRGETKKKNNQN